jgi:hypothetical protein
MPLLLPYPPFTSPANKDTAEVERTILRIILLSASATRAKLPSEETLTPEGDKKRAFVPRPLLVAGTPSPADKITKNKSSERMVNLLCGE